ncbi:carboxypeptidase-like regulatory domain-containing protein [Flavobacteriaceae bacterium R38]|nr:carboxypeptidase-like regulatory domain-containing protein [Flavobacteriaceae bacterium R38]
MRKIFLGIFFLLFCSLSAWSQTKIGGVVVDEEGKPVPFANIIFKNSSEGTITNDNGRFYFESENTYSAIIVSFIGYTTQEIELTKRVTYDLNIVLVAGGEQLDEVVVYTGKQSKKNNPAIDILRKIWAKKRENGINKFKQYEYDEYEKIEFDFNTIDSAMINSRLFKGLEFVFDDLDTSRITGKTYLPIFINEAFSKVYGDNKLKKIKEELVGNKNSGFDSNQSIIAFVQDLYADYDIYNNYLKFFDKSFVSPLSRGGIDVYNYVLADTAYIDNKWCYNIIYYPRRKNELTFKGDFWVNDSTFAIKKINMAATKSANINWVKEIYIEQEFDVVNDSVFLLKRDYFLSDFSLNKKEKSRGIYGKRTTVYDNYKFDQEKPSNFYDRKVDIYDEQVYNRDDDFWEKNRLEKLNEDEKGIYKLVDTILTVPKFKRLYSVGTVLATGYYEFDKLNFDFGPVFSTFGANEAEGLRIRAGGRTFFSSNDAWRLEGYTAYGFKDNKFKYGISGKWLIDRKNRIIISGGNRRDIEQIGVSLTATNDVLGRSFASSAIFTTSANNTLTNINLTTAAIEFEPFRNVILRTGGSYRTLKSALPEEFNLDYVNPESPTGVSSEVKQVQLNVALEVTPKRKTLGYGVERVNVNDDFSRFLISYSQGFDGFTDNDFDFSKVQLFYRKPTQIGGLGRLLTTVELGKTFGDVPLSLLSPVPGNQTFFSIFNTFPNLDFYEFVTDTYASVHLEQNFGGRLFSRIPWLRDLNLREIVGVRGIWGDLSDANIALSSPTNIPLLAPNEQIYWEYSFGIGNIFKVFRIDFNFRGNYLDLPDARRFSVTGAFGFFF